MATKIDDMYIRAGVDLSGVERGLRDFQRQTQTSADRVVKSLSGINTGVDKLERGFNTLRNVAIVALTVQLGRMAAGVLNAAGALADAADAAGLSIERYQELRFAAQLAGVSQESFSSAMAKFARTVGDAAAGEKAAAEALNDLGVNIRFVDGTLRSQDDILNDVIAGIGQYQSQAERASAAATFFGRDAGPKFAAFIGQGSDAIDELIAKARKLGLVLDEDVVRNADAASDNLETLGIVIQQKLTAAIAKAAPTINWLVDAIVWLLEPFDTRTKIEIINDQLSELDETLKRVKEGDPEGVVGYFAARFGAKDETIAGIEARKGELELERSDIDEMSGRGITMPKPATAKGGNRIKPSGGGGGLSKLQQARQRIGDVNDALQQTIDISTLALLEMPMAALADAEKKKFDAIKDYQTAMDELAVEGQEHIREIMNDVAEDNARKAKDVEEAWSGAFENIGRTIIDTLTDSTLSASDKMKRIMFTALEQIAAAAMKSMGMESPFGSLGSALGGWLGGLFSGGSNFGTGTIVGGPSFGGYATLAEGGPLKAGQPALVGERGPEMIVPTSNGMVLNHQQTSALLDGGGGRSVVQQFTFNVGTGASEAAMVVRQMLPQIMAYAKAGVSADLSRNGSIRQNLRAT